jgi:hypothetical protein
MGRSTPPAIVVTRISFETTRLSPQCLAEAYARVLPLVRRPVRTTAAAPTPAQTRRTDHG